MSAKLIDPYDTTRCWTEWTDVLGQKFGPGDYVAYASVSGKSPQLVVAKVVRINRFNSSGKLITEYPYYGGYHSTRQGRLRVRVESCTITVLPIIDARGFYRSKRNGGVKAVTLQIARNVMKVHWKACEEHDPE